MAGLPGYPGPQQVQQAAQNDANAAVPTRGSIMSQYGQSLGDVSAFTRALVSLLRGSPNPGAGYSSAEQAQSAVDNTIASRLAALGGQYGAGSAAAASGLGGSALSSLLAKGAAATAYGNK